MTQAHPEETGGNTFYDHEVSRHNWNQGQSTIYYPISTFTIQEHLGTMGSLASQASNFHSAALSPPTAPSAIALIPREACEISRFTERVLSRSQGHQGCALVLSGYSSSSKNFSAAAGLEQKSLRVVWWKVLGKIIASPLVMTNMAMDSHYIHKKIDGDFP